MDVKQTIANAVNKVEEAVGVKAEVQVPTVSPASEAPSESVAQVAAKPDRSAYNCPDCKGEGLKSDTEKCPTCGGTGKV